MGFRGSEVQILSPRPKLSFNFAVLPIFLIRTPFFMGGDLCTTTQNQQLCHTGKSRNPVLSSTFWIPVSTGVTNKGAVQRSRIVNAFGGKFDFLGFTIWMGKSGKTGNHCPHVQPSKKSLQTIKDRVTNLTTRNRTIMPLEWGVNEVNATVRGWVGYFHYRNCSQSMGQIRHHVEERLITHLRKRHKVRDSLRESLPVLYSTQLSKECLTESLLWLLSF